MFMAIILRDGAQVEAVGQCADQIINKKQEFYWRAYVVSEIKTEWQQER